MQFLSNPGFKKLFPLVILSLLILIFFSRYLTGENLFFAADEAASDLLDFYYPQRAYLAEHLKNNQIPLWTPYQENGFPFLAEAQTGIFYPPNLFLFKFLPTPLAFNWSIISAYFILGFGTYFFIKNLKLSNIAAFFGSLTIIFSGFFIAHLKHVPLLQAAAFFPWILLLTDQIISTQKLRYVIFLSIAAACSILAGHLPTAYSVLLVSLIYFIVRLNQQFKKSGEALKPVIFFPLAIILALGICAIQLFPTMEMIPFSTRTTPLSANASSNIPLDQLITFLSPYHFGDPSRGFFYEGRPSFWENAGYIGLIPLLLALSTFFIKKTNSTVFKILLIGCFFLVLGSPSEIFQMIWNFLPGLAFTRIPTRFLLFVDFFLIILASISVEKIFKHPIFEIRAMAIIICFITFLDLGYNFYPYNGEVSTKTWQQTPKSANFLLQDPEYFRISNLNQGAFYYSIYNQGGGWREDNSTYVAGKEFLPSTLNSLFKVPSIHFQYEYSGSFALNRRMQLSSLTQGAPIGNPYASKLLGLQNVKYILTTNPPPVESTSSFKLVSQPNISSESATITILENPKFLPRAYLVSDQVVLPEARIIAFMTTPEFDPQTQVVLEENVPLSTQTNPNIKSNIKIQQNEETKLVFQVESSKSAFFVLTDSFYPGWKAKIDNKEVQILQANYAFRAIPISAGKHTVEFYFQPMSFYIGLIISVITIIFIIICIILFKRNL